MKVKMKELRERGRDGGMDGNSKQWEKEGGERKRRSEVVREEGGRRARDRETEKKMETLLPSC